MEKKKYSIEINKMVYCIPSDDDEEYIGLLESRLKRAMEESSTDGSSNQILSNYAMRIAIYLADEALRADIEHKKKIEKMEQKLPGMLKKLEESLGDSG